MDQYEVHQRLSAITDEELEALVREHLPGHYARRQAG